ADEANSRARFLLEAEITGSLEHPGIVPVYSLGAYPDGRPFYAMRFIRGETLKEAVDRWMSSSASESERALQYRQLLARFMAACHAIAYAHSRGVLHRDVKPANIMLGPYGETLVVDWGLAKAVGKGELSGSEDQVLAPASVSASTPTRVGAVLGTPQFMSPEQASGLLEHLGPASDVYSLGATLYYMLTGQSAFESPDVFHILDNVSHGRFPQPRQIRPHVPPALQAICVKAMAMIAKNRYRTATELADAI